MFPRIFRSLTYLDLPISTALRPHGDKQKACRNGRAKFVGKRTARLFSWAPGSHVPEESGAAERGHRWDLRGIFSEIPATDAYQVRPGGS